MLTPQPVTTYAQSAQSPTGRNPKLLWTPERQATWNRMVADYNANPSNPATEGGRLFKDLKTWSDNKAIRGSYEGQWDLLLYQMTGDKVYADRAWNTISSKVINKTIPFQHINYLLGDVLTSVKTYEWLKPALTPEQDTAFREYLLVIGKAFVTNNNLEGTAGAFGGYGARQGDSDLIIGMYFSLAMIDIVTDRLGSGFLDGTYIDARGFGEEPVGGLVATGANRNTMRNEIKEYFETSKGGAWLESSMYNLLTPQGFLLGAEAIETATGTDYFPEIREWALKAGDQWINAMAPDFATSSQSYQWGDVDNGVRRLWIQHSSTLAGIMSGYLKGTEEGKRVQKLAREFFDHPEEFGRGKWPFPEFYYLYDPYAPDAEFRTLDKLTSFSAEGMGLNYVHTSWKAAGTLFGSQMQPNTRVDHNPFFFGNFQLYRKNVWAVTNPIGWGQPENYVGNDATNGMLIGGLSSLAEARGQIGLETASDGLYSYHAGSTAGHWASPGGIDPKEGAFYQPPPRAVHEWTRSLIYLPSADEKSDTIIVFDRVHADNPFSLPRSDRYWAQLQTKMKRILASGGLKQWIIHSPVAPDTSDGITWSVGSQTVKVTPLLPTFRKYNVINETDWFSDVADVVVGPNERKFHTKISPTTDKPWDTFLNVVQAYDSGFQPSNTLVKSGNGEAEGVLVRRAGHDDVLALFNAKQSPKLSQALEERAAYDTQLLAKLSKNRLHKSSFSLSYTSNTANSQVLIADLDPAVNWEVSVDGQRKSLSVSNQAIGRLAVTGTGAHTLEVIANGEAAPPPPPPSGDDGQQQPESKEATLTLTKSVNKAAANEGDTLTYTLSYTNTGEGNATNVRLSDPIPANATYVVNSASANGSYDASANKLTWNIGNVAAGASGSVTFQVTVNQATGGGDTGGGTLNPATTIYLSPSGNDANACTETSRCKTMAKALTLLKPGWSVLLAEGSYPGFFKADLDGTQAAPITIKGEGNGATFQPRGTNQDTIHLIRSNYWVFDNIIADGAVGNASASRAGMRINSSHNVTVKNSKFRNNGAWGIFTNHSDNTHLENNEASGSQGEHGIYISNSSDNATVRGNRIFNNAGSGLQINADISVCPNTEDTSYNCDGISTGNIIEKNTIYENGSKIGGAAINLDGVQNSVVRNNVLYDNHATGIANFKQNAAAGSKGMEIYHNTIVMASDGRWAVLFWNTAGPSTVRNNILYNKNANRGGLTFLNPADVSNTNTDHNIYGGGTRAATPDDSATSYTLSQWQALGKDTHSDTGTLANLFTNSSSHDYTSPAGAPSIDKGQTLSSVATDLLGKARPTGSASDIGAYER